MKTSTERVAEALDAGHRYPKAIATRTGMTVRAVQQALSRMERAKAVERVGFAYQLTTAGSEAFHAKQRSAA